MSSFTNAAGGATMKSNQVFGPYGNTRYNAGSLNTAKGFIGQYNDGTGLDYFNARYYDPIVGVFLAADTVQGNAQGLNPYGYVNGNPETYSDPSGRYVVGAGGQTYYPGSPYYMQGGVAMSIAPDPNTGKSFPYTGNGFVNGWRPGQGPNALPPSTNPCQTCAVKPGASHPASGGIKNTPLFALGVAKAGTGFLLIAAALFGFAATLDVPFIDWILGFAKNVFQIGLRAIIAGIDSGLNDIENSLVNPDPRLKVIIDIVKLGLDVIGVVTNFVMTITSLQGAADVLGKSGSFFRALKDLATESVQGGAYANKLNLARLNIVNGIFGGYSVVGDWNQLNYNIQAADATSS